MKKTKIIAVNLLAVVSIAVAIFYTDYAISNQPEVVTFKEKPVLPRVTIQQVNAGDFYSLIEAFGEVRTSENLTLLSQASGQVVWKSEHFSKGRRVKKGDRLLRIEDSNYRVALANAKKELANASFALLQEQRKNKRAKENWKRSGITEEPSELALRKPQLDIAQTQYKAAKELVAFAQNDLSHTEIYAPFDAVITAQSVTLGTYLSQGSNVAQLNAIDSAEIKVALSENQWQQLPKSFQGVKVVIHSTFDPKQQWSGAIKDLALVVDNKNRTRLLTIEVARPLENETPLLFGSFVKVRLEGKKQPDTFSIPASSVTADGNIWLEINQTLVKHKIAVAFNSGKFVGMAKGNLSEQLHLVRRPLSNYFDGMQVVAVTVENRNAE